MALHDRWVVEISHGFKELVSCSVVLFSDRVILLCRDAASLLGDTVEFSFNFGCFFFELLVTDDRSDWLGGGTGWCGHASSLSILCSISHAWAVARHHC